MPTDVARPGRSSTCPGGALPVPAELSAHLREQRFFRLSTVWAVTYLINAVGTIWLLPICPSAASSC
jgi:hypothetical protein